MSLQNPLHQFTYQNVATIHKIFRIEFSSGIVSPYNIFIFYINTQYERYTLIQYPISMHITYRTVESHILRSCGFTCAKFSIQFFNDFVYLRCSSSFTAFSLSFECMNYGNQFNIEPKTRISYNTIMGTNKNNNKGPNEDCFGSQFFFFSILYLISKLNIERWIFSWNAFRSNLLPNWQYQ